MKTRSLALLWCVLAPCFSSASSQRISDQIYTHIDSLQIQKVLQEKNPALTFEQVSEISQPEFSAVALGPAKTFNGVSRVVVITLHHCILRIWIGDLVIAGQIKKGDVLRIRTWIIEDETADPKQSDLAIDWVCITTKVAKKVVAEK